MAALLLCVDAVWVEPTNQGGIFWHLITLQGRESPFNSWLECRFPLILRVEARLLDCVLIEPVRAPHRPTAMHDNTQQDILHSPAWASFI